MEQDDDRHYQTILHNQNITNAGSNMTISPRKIYRKIFQLAIELSYSKDQTMILLMGDEEQFCSFPVSSVCSNSP